MKRFFLFLRNLLRILSNVLVLLSLAGFFFLGIPTIFEEIKPNAKYAWLIYGTLFLFCLGLLALGFWYGFEKGCDRFSEDFEKIYQ